MQKIYKHFATWLIVILTCITFSNAHFSKNNESELLFQEEVLGSGYFGEYVPRGMSLSTIVGEYRYFQNDSKMVYVPEGPFIKGDVEFINSKPLQRVTLSKYYIDKYEVTVSQYRQFCYATERELPEQPNESEDDHPIVNVTWEEANAYAEWVGKSLPTEAQWEKAARGGFVIPQWGIDKKPLPLYENPLPIRIYTWGNTSPKTNLYYLTNYRADDTYSAKGKDGYEYTAPVGKFSENEGFVYGCHDLCGNAREWCSDYYQGTLDKNTTDPKGPETGTKRVIRGGGWDSDAKGCRIGYRTFGEPNYRHPSLGFRLVKNLD